MGWAVDRGTRVTEYLDSLLRFLDDQVMRGVREEIERNKKGLYTFEYY